jgi:glycine dehydrogenase subunit 2
LTFKQATWNEPLIFELSRKGKIGQTALRLTEEERSALVEAMKNMPESMLRKSPPSLPEVSEVEVVRHFTRLSQENYGVDLGTYPLGSCTMKYNPKICEVLASLPELKNLHPHQDITHAQGVLRVLYELSEFLAEITGMSKFSLQPSAGAQGELCGALIIRAAHKERNELDKRTEMIVPDSAHGTNPASAAMAGFKVVVVPSDGEGCVDIEALKGVVGDRTAGMMITNPNTLGIFERRILEVAEIVHEAGGLMYYDGANLNAILGKARPREMGFDVTHVNIHKTFGTPHGGGGPGAGPVGVTEELAQFLPVPTVEFDGQKYYLEYNRPKSIGKLRAFYGNVSVLLRAYAYILLHGADGLEEIAEVSVLNANYLARKILASGRYQMPFDSKNARKHEIVVSAEKIAAETGIRALDISKRLLDFGVHAPTIYFPLIVKEALMIEPTETESIEALDRYAELLEKIAEDAYRQPDTLKEAPQNTSVGRVDDIAASHPKTMCLTWRMYQRKQAIP